jgi:hypothetical protein
MNGSSSLARAIRRRVLRSLQLIKDLTVRFVDVV